MKIPLLIHQKEFNKIESYLGIQRGIKKISEIWKQLFTIFNDAYLIYSDSFAVLFCSKGIDLLFWKFLGPKALIRKKREMQCFNYMFSHMM